MEAMRSVLASFALSAYAQAFEDEGYDDLAYLLTQSEPQLRRTASDVGLKPGHVAKFATWMRRLQEGGRPGDPALLTPASRPGLAPRADLDVAAAVGRRRLDSAARAP